jgi:hypothetical protein
MEMIEAKIFWTLITAYFLFKSERLRASIKLSLLKAVIKSVMTYACPAWEFTADSPPLKISLPARQGSPHYG